MLSESETVVLIITMYSLPSFATSSIIHFRFSLSGAVQSERAVPS